MESNQYILLVCRDQEICRKIKDILRKIELETVFLLFTGAKELKRQLGNRFFGILIDLNLAPAQGRDMGIYFRKYKYTRYLPLVFLDGDPDKVERIRKILPDAFYISTSEIQTQLPSILEIINEDPVVPDSIFEAYRDVPLVKKLGILPSMRLLLINAPKDFIPLIMNVENLEIINTQIRDNDMILWFLSSEEHINNQLQDILPLVGKGGIWMFWQKKQNANSPYWNEVMVRKLGLSNGLVDYKICSVNSEWTGLKFVIRKKPIIKKDANGKKNKIQPIRLVMNITHIKNKPVIVLGEQIIPIEIHYDKRKNLQLILEREPKLVVKSPKGISEEKILQAIFYRMKWIVKRLKHQEEIKPFTSKFTYTDGEKHLYLGQEYELRIHKGKFTKVWFSDPHIVIEVPEPENHEQIKDALQNWYAGQTTEYVSQRTWHFIKQFVSLKLHSNIEFKFRRMKSRWGSCSSTGLITFNKELIRAPREAIDYLIVHELCHLKHHDHSASFYKELTSIMPDWKIYRRMLERISLS